jgi:hypothetical protein
MADLIPQLRQTFPAVLRDAGEDASSRVIEFFTVEIHNPNTREAFARAVRRFFRWGQPSDSSIYPILSCRMAISGGNSGVSV